MKTPLQDKDTKPPSQAKNSRIGDKYATVNDETLDSRFASLLDKVTSGDGEPQLSHEEFIRRAILNLRDISKSRGIHSVFSNFNQAFRLYYPGENPVEIILELQRRGKLEIRPVRRGVMLYLPGEAPYRRPDEGAQALKKILEEGSIGS